MIIHQILVPDTPNADTKQKRRRRKTREVINNVARLLILLLLGRKLKQTVTPAEVAGNVNGTSFHIFHYFDASHHHSFVCFYVFDFSRRCFMVQNRQAHFTFYSFSPLKDDENCLAMSQHKYV
jgi:hypothetical protein